jgi:hypothetical protein
VSDHFYTTDAFEAARAMGRSGYHWEGIACGVFAPQAGQPVGSIAFFRLFNPDTGDHFYTIDVNERDRAISQYGYRSEATACFIFSVASPQLIPLYRLWNGEAHDHFYTTDVNERDRARVVSGYADEGTAGFVFPTGVPSGVPTALYRIYKPDKSFWDEVGDFFSGIANSIWDALSTAGGAIVDALDALGLGWVLDGFSWLLEHLLGSFGPFRDFWNGLLTLFWGLLNPFSFLDDILGFLGIRPEKKMRVMVVIQRDEGEQAVASAAEILPLLQVAIDTFKGQANVRLIPVGPFNFTSPFQDLPTASLDYIYTESTISDPGTLDVNCGGDLFLDDLGTVGFKFNNKLTDDFFYAGWRRVLGYGAPVIAFAVRSFKDRENPDRAGCSLGPLADWVVVDFGHASPRTLAHEFGHACNLWHPMGPPDPDNLMTPGGRGGTGLSLHTDQIVVLRASRHCTYF